MKDNFSTHSDQYAKYRPTYPPELFSFLYENVPAKHCAWDCGTGNGQVAIELSKTFHQVFATDISQQQIDNAIQAPNIFYSVQPAEKTNFAHDQFDLIVVAQAIHWFNFQQFFEEVRRTAKNNALLCVVGYDLLRITPPIDNLIADFYHNVIGQYWDKERKYVDEKYQTIPFPFDELPAPPFTIELDWTMEHLVGYLNTWSAVKHFIKQNHYNPVDALQTTIAEHWQRGAVKRVQFPLLLRVGCIRK